MIAGQLKLYGMQGIFYNRMLHSTTQGFEDSEQTSFDGMEDFETLANDLETRFYFTPLEVDGITEYITGSFTDTSTGTTPYKVTIWLLVEECAIPTQEYCNTNCNG